MTLTGQYAIAEYTFILLISAIVVSSTLTFPLGESELEELLSFSSPERIEALVEEIRSNAKTNMSCGTKSDSF